MEAFWAECDPNKENLCLYGASPCPLVHARWAPLYRGGRRGECPCARAPAPDCPARVAWLTGNSDGTWKVGLPVEEVPPELPEPALGINFARDGMAVRAPAHPAR